jgi:hypothetical protein
VHAWPADALIRERPCHERPCHERPCPERPRRAQAHFHKLRESLEREYYLQLLSVPRSRALAAAAPATAAEPSKNGKDASGKGDGAKAAASDANADAGGARSVPSAPSSLPGGGGSARAPSSAAANGEAGTPTASRVPHATWHSASGPVVAASSDSRSPSGRSSWKGFWRPHSAGEIGAALPPGTSAAGGSLARPTPYLAYGLGGGGEATGGGGGGGAPGQLAPWPELSSVASLALPSRDSGGGIGGGEWEDARARANGGGGGEVALMVGPPLPPRAQHWTEATPSGRPPRPRPNAPPAPPLPPLPPPPPPPPPLPPPPGPPPPGSQQHRDALGGVQRSASEWAKPGGRAVRFALAVRTVAPDDLPD